MKLTSKLLLALGAVLILWNAAGKLAYFLNITYITNPMELFAVALDRSDWFLFSIVVELFFVIIQFGLLRKRNRTGQQTFLYIAAVTISVIISFGGLGGVYRELLNLQQGGFSGILAFAFAVFVDACAEFCLSEALE